MDSRPSADELLAHFDRPQRLEMLDFEWDENILPSAAGIEVPVVAPATPVSDRFVEVPHVVRRGVGWVFAWGTAVAVTIFATVVLVKFAYLLAAEHALSVAARAGAMEATLPRATGQSVAATVERRLARYPALAKQVRLTLMQNGSIVQSAIRPHDGDRFALAISAPASAAIPGWLRAVLPSRRDSDIQVRAEQQVPGRKLAIRTDLSARN